MSRKFVKPFPLQSHVSLLEQPCYMQYVCNIGMIQLFRTILNYSHFYLNYDR